MPPRARKTPVDPDAAEVPSSAVGKLATARAQIKQWKEIEDAARAEILDALNGKSKGTENGKTVVVVKEVKSNRIDTTALREDNPEIAALYTKPSVSTRVEIVKEVDDDDEE